MRALYRPYGEYIPGLIPHLLTSYKDVDEAREQEQLVLCR